MLADATLSGLIADRFYPVQFKEGFTIPAVAYQRMPGGSRPRTMHQVGNTEWGRLCWARYQFTCAGAGVSGAEQARVVAQAVKDASKTFDLSRNPVVTGQGAPNFVLSEWEQLQPNTTPIVFLRFVDIQIFIREEN